jgi:hypothetical protein
MGWCADLIGYILHEMFRLVPTLHGSLRPLLAQVA